MLDTSPNSLLQWHPPRDIGGNINGMDSVPGWDPHLLNKEMIEMLRRDSADTAERIETSPNPRWQEGHKKSIDKLADGITEFAYQALALQYIMTCVPACETTRSGEDNKGDTLTSLRDLMTPEEIARYDAYWNNVADDMLKSSLNSYR